MELTHPAIKFHTAQPGTRSVKPELQSLNYGAHPSTGLPPS